MCSALNESDRMECLPAFVLDPGSMLHSAFATATKNLATDECRNGGYRGIACRNGSIYDYGSNASCHEQDFA